MVRLILQVFSVSRKQLLSYRSIDELIERDALAVCASGRPPANIVWQGQIKHGFGRRYRADPLPGPVSRVQLRLSLIDEK